MMRNEADAETDFDKLISLLRLGVEELVLSQLRDFKRQYGADEFLSRAEPLLLTIDSLATGDVIRGNALLLASFQGKANVVSELLNMGMSLRARTTSAEILYHQLSPLILAAVRGKLAVVRLLLSKGDDVLYISPHGKPVITYAANDKICDAILNEAATRNCLDALLGQRCLDRRLDIWHVCCLLGYAKTLQRLIKVPGLERHTNIQSLYQLACGSPLNYPDQYQTFKNIANDLKDTYALQAAPSQCALDFDLSVSSDPDLEVGRYYQQLFGAVMLPFMAPTREHVLRRAHAKFFALLMNPASCMKYLRHLDKEFERYCVVKFAGVALPAVDPNQFDFRVIGGAYYPIPKRNSVYANHKKAKPYNKKHSALQEFLLLVLNQYGLGRRVTKWVGFMPQAIADEQVAHGDMTLEGKYNHASIFHGTVSHTYQLIFLAYAVADGEIPLEYVEGGVTKKLTLLEICRSQVEMMSQHPNGGSIFGHMRDTRYFTQVSFADPHRLFSIIMRDGHLHGLPNLANSLIDTFCKSIWKFFLNAKKLMNGLECYEDFIDMLSGLPSDLFTNTNGFNLLAVEKYESSPANCRVQRDGHHGFSYASVDRTYHPSRHFSPCRFEDQPQPAVLKKNECSIL